MKISRNMADHLFSRVPSVNVPRSTFDRGFQHKTTFNAGYLIPIYLDEMLPGDTFSCRMDGFARIATLAVPIMDNLYLETFYFFVPNRLLQTNWERLCGSQDNPGDSTDYLVPQVQLPVGGAAEMSLADYFGIPTKVGEIFVNALPFRALNKIYNDWFRDENMQDSLPLPLDDGPDDYSDYNLFKRGKRHDYFTSALPWPQKGPDVLLPLGLSAPVIPDPSTDRIPTWNFGGYGVNLASNGGGQNAAVYSANIGGSASQGVWQNPKLITDLSDAVSASVNQFRLAFQTQRIYEKDARSGTRYFEVLQGHFNVINPDLRLQRSHYLGGGHTPVLINPVAQTSRSEDNQPLAQLGAYGVSAPTGHGFTYSATEFGYVIGLACIRADLTYQQGLDKLWSRRTRLDFYWPSFAHLGEQAVLSKEIYCDGTADDETVFGYQERFAEYRYKRSMVTGLFRSNATQSLDYWHLAQDFANRPVLGPTFIEENVPIERVEAFPDEVDFIFDSEFSLRCTRVMPVRSVPGYIDHF